MSNARLIEALDAHEVSSPSGPTSSAPCARSRADQRRHRPSAVLQLGVDEAARLLRADGARIDLIDPTLGLLRWAYASGAIQPATRNGPTTQTRRSTRDLGQAVVSGRAFWSAITSTTRASPRPGADQYVSGPGCIVMAAPLTVEVSRSAR
jgi:hypothetical protein